MLSRYGKHLPNKQQSHQHNLPRWPTGYNQYSNNSGVSGGGGGSFGSANGHLISRSSSMNSNILHKTASFNNFNNQDFSKDHLDDTGENPIHYDDKTLEDFDGHNLEGDLAAVSRSGSYDTDSGLTEGRHCDLFSEKQGSVLWHDSNPPNHQQHPYALGSSSSQGGIPRRHPYAKQIRINSTNRMANDETPLNKALRSSTLGIAAISGSTLGSSGCHDKSPMVGETTAASIVGSRNSLHHNIYSNDSYESRFVNDHHSMSASSTFLLEDSSEAGEDVGLQKTFIVPLDIPTPPPQPHLPHGRPVCQCENIGTRNNGCHDHFHQVTTAAASASAGHRPPPHRSTSVASLQKSGNTIETPLANGFSHHQHHHQMATTSTTSRSGGGLNYKLHDPQQQLQNHALQQSPHRYHSSTMGSHQVLTKLQQHHHVYPQLSPYLGNQRNSFHKKDNTGYMKVRARGYQRQQLTTKNMIPNQIYTCSLARAIVSCD